MERSSNLLRVRPSSNYRFTQNGYGPWLRKQYEFLHKNILNIQEKNLNNDIDNDGKIA